MNESILRRRIVELGSILKLLGFSGVLAGVISIIRIFADVRLRESIDLNFTTQALNYILIPLQIPYGVAAVVAGSHIARFHSWARKSALLNALILGGGLLAVLVIAIIYFPIEPKLLANIFKRVVVVVVFAIPEMLLIHFVRWLNSPPVKELFVP